MIVLRVDVGGMKVSKKSWDRNIFSDVFYFPPTMDNVQLISWAVAGFHSWPQCHHGPLAQSPFAFPSLIRAQTTLPDMMCQAKTVTNSFQICLVRFSFDLDVIFGKNNLWVMSCVYGLSPFVSISSRRILVVLRFMSEGFLDAKKLALKFSTLYALNKDSFSTS